MKMLRGACTFLVFVAIFVLAECKREQAQKTATQEQITATSAAAPPTTTIPYPCLGTNQMCPDPCIVYLKVKDKTDDDSVEVDKAWVYKGQQVIFRPQADKTPKAGNEPKAEEVRFLEPKETIGKKGGNDKHQDPAVCDTASGDCTKTIDGFTKCQPYTYIATVYHNKKHKKSDPEIEVGGTTTGVVSTADTSGTSTSGTTTNP